MGLVQSQLHRQILLLPHHLTIPLPLLLPRLIILAQNSNPNPNIHSGLGQSNLLGVVANNTSISLYVNDQLINSIQDSNYSQGQIGVEADSNNSPTEVVFTNAKVWTF